MSKKQGVQPELAELFARYLNSRAQEHAAGMAVGDVEGEVLPYEAGPVQPIDAKLAWHETTLVAEQFGLDAKLALPPHWPSLVAGHEPVVALAFAFGNFAQMVRHFHTILQSKDLTALRPSVNPSRPTPVAGELLEWARKIAAGKPGPQLLLAIGSLRLAKQFEEAAQIVAQHDANIPTGLRPAWDNERAALAWHAGKAAEANALWHKMQANPVVLFNHGMSDLFLGRTHEAQQSLEKAVAALPEGGWYHLGRLYLALTSPRS